MSETEPTPRSDQQRGTGDRTVPEEASPQAKNGNRPAQPSGEKGGPKGPEPTRYGDWEKGGRCFDF